MTDPYAVMGLLPDADADVIKAAYRTLAQKCHPDLAGPSSEARMKALTAAYALLSDPVRRAAWDSATTRSVATPSAETQALRRQLPELHPVASLLLLVVGALAWHLYFHAPWQLSVLLAYPVAALPTGARVWMRARRARGDGPVDVSGCQMAIDNGPRPDVLAALGDALVILLVGTLLWPFEMAWLALLRPAGRLVGSELRRRRGGTSASRPGGSRI